MIPGLIFVLGSSDTRLAGTNATMLFTSYQPFAGGMWFSQWNGLTEI